MENGTTKTLSKPDKPSYMALYKDSLVWINTEHNRVFLTDLGETFQQTVGRVRGGESFQDPSVNDRLITWDNGSGAIVWDRKQNRLVTVADKDVGRIFLSAHDFIWVGPTSDTPGADVEINILDTDRLP
jgi:hypothetical protein